MRTAPITVVLVTVLLATGCAGGSSDKNSSGERDSAACFDEVKGPGDLEVTDSVFTVINPDASKNYLVTYAVEVTNRSKSRTVMAAGLRVDLVDESGKPVEVSEPDGLLDTDRDSSNTGWVEYVAPGERRYFAGTFTDAFKQRPADMTIELPYQLAEDDTEDDISYWMPSSKVVAPHKLDVNDINFSKDRILSFDMYNDTDQTFDGLEMVIVLRDSEGNLLGGQYSGPNSEFAPNVLEAQPGHTEVEDGPFRSGVPKTIDAAKTEVQLSNSPGLNEIDSGCSFVSI